jgi:acyl carrier protein
MVTDAQLLQVKKMLIEQLRLRMEPEEIADDAQLFGEGLGLDSVDAIELIAAVEQSFGVVISSEEQAQQVLRDVRTLTEHIVAEGGIPA